MGSEVVLVVCTANVCRSPLAEMLLRLGLARELELRIESAGTHARDGDHACTLVARRQSGAQWAQQAQAHEARMVSSDLLDRSGLILAASSDIRSEIVRLNPEVRDRTFTFREAAHRGAQFDPGSHTRPAGVVGAYAAHLDRARSTMAPVPSTRGLWRRSGSNDEAISIADGHRAGARLHRRALKEVSDAVGEVVTHFNRYVLSNDPRAIAGDGGMP